MYKVFFKDRIVFFEKDFGDTFKNNSGLFYKFRDRGELSELINAFFRLEKIDHLYLFHNDVDLLKNKFASCFKQINASGGLVIRNNNEFLMIFRNGVWDLPKGKNDPGETSEVTALREVSEECGLKDLIITREIAKTYHTYLQDDKPVLKETTWFGMISFDEEDPVPQISENITQVAWLGSGDICRIMKNTYPSVLEVLSAGNLL